jgi:hypothetical protein
MILAVMAGESRPAAADRGVGHSIDDLLSEVAREVPAFGGMFIDSQGRLAIYLTDERQFEAARAAITAVFGRGRVDVADARALPARYTFAELKRWHDRHRLDTLAIPGVVMTSIHKSSNRLRVGVESAGIRRGVEAVLTGAGVPADAVEIVEMDPIAPFETLTDTRRPLLGGLLITNDIESGCTLGFLAVLQDKAGFVTNSHCTNVAGGVEGTVMHQATISDDLNRVGVEMADPSYFSGSNCPAGRQCRLSDSAFVARNGGPSQSTPRAEGAFGRLAYVDSALNIFSEFEIVDKVFAPIDGEEVFKLGMTSGITSGKISDSCTDLNKNGTNKTLLCQNLVEQTGSAKGGLGDSGSAVFRTIGTPLSNLPPVTLYGLVWGGNDTYFSFSPLSFIELELGPLRAFPGDLGNNSLPEVKIRQPLNFSQVGVGGLNSVGFEADIVDYEGCCQDVTWTSDLDGVIGHGPGMEFTFPSPGLRTITVTVTDDDGGKASDSIKIAAGTSQPTVTIVKPTAAQALLTGVINVFSGTSLDPNGPFFSMPCAALTWTSSNLADPFPVTGCNPQVTFQTAGFRTLTLTGAGAFGLTAVDTVGVNVTTAPPTNPPAVTILNPLDDYLLSPSAAVTLTGTVQDPANSGALSYQWVLLNGSTQTVLDTGSVNSGGTITLPWTPGNDVGFHCGGTGVTLKLEVTNPNTGKVGSATVDVHISYPTC